MINRLLAAVVMGVALGCAGGDDGPSSDDADASSTEPTTVEVVPAKSEPQIPLCEGSPEESSELCQSLRYGSHGYCNFWIDCSSIH